MSAAPRRAFERAASVYDAHSVLPQEVGRRLLEHLEGIRIDPQVIVDLGCGTGASFDGLRTRYPHARLVGLDFAHAMLVRAAARAPWWKRAFGASTPALACADAHKLPLAAASTQLVFSNLMLQWCRPEAVFAEVARILPPGGLFMFSTFGPDTLKELRAALAAARAGNRVNTFVDMHDLGDMLVQASFADPVMEMEMLTLEYGTLDVLLEDLRAVGSHSSAGARAEGARTDWDAVRREYEKCRRNGALPATYEVVYGHAWKVAPRRLADGRQVIEFQGRR
jgi:malonyl-CoA O-methyltransferase